MHFPAILLLACSFAVSAMPTGLDFLPRDVIADGDGFARSERLAGRDPASTIVATNTGIVPAVVASVPLNASVNANTGSGTTTGTTTGTSTGASTQAGANVTANANANANTNFTTTQANTIVDDLTQLNKDMDGTVSALSGFSGGSTLGDQASGTAVNQAYLQVQSSTRKLQSDLNALGKKGQFAAADSARISTVFNSTLASNITNFFSAFGAKKAVYDRYGYRQLVSNSLSGFAQDLATMHDSLGPLLGTQDKGKTQSAANRIYPAVINSINNYNN